MGARSQAKSGRQGRITTTSGKLVSFPGFGKGGLKGPAGDVQTVTY
jgi:hypothetical protein